MTTSTEVSVGPLGTATEVSPLNEGNPLGWLAQWWRGLAPDPDLPMLWWRADVDGRAAGFAVLARGALSTGGYGNALVHVLPGARRRGAGTALRAVLEESARGHVPGVVYYQGDEDPDADAAVAAWGLTVSARHSESVLDLTALDRGELARLAARPGVTLRPLPDLERLSEADWEDLHAFFVARYREAPDAADGGGDLSPAFFRGVVSEPACLLLAEEDQQRIGLTLVIDRPGDPEARNTLLTGVSPAARGRGVALALKARHAQLMADAGVTRLYTQNMVGNEPILAANRRLGFVRASGYCEVPVALG